MLLITCLLAVLAIAVFALLAAMVRQNRSLWQQLQGIGRPLPELFRHTLVMWSPLAVFIIMLVLVANVLSSAAIALTYRLTVIDEFCEVAGSRAALIVPCTRVDRVLPREAVVAAGGPGDVDAFISRRYQQARRAVLAQSADSLVVMAQNRPAFYRALSAQAVLGLAVAPEDDFQLDSLKQALRGLLHTPAPPASDVFDYLRYIAERDARLQRMRLLTARVLARRRQVNDAAYAGLAAHAQARAWLRNDISHLLAPVAVRSDPLLDGKLAGAGMQARNPNWLESVRGDMLRILAVSEASVARLLLPRADAPRGAKGLYLALDVPRRCKLTGLDDSVFECAHLPPGEEELSLRSLGFSNSVRISIDRWHERLLRSSFRGLGEASLAAKANATAASDALASAIPDQVHLGRADCGLMRPANCLANAAHLAAEQAYARERERARLHYERAAGQARGLAIDSIDARISAVLSTLDDELETIRQHAHAFANRAFALGTVLRILGWLSLALVTVKSFLYVLALELFRTENGAMSIGFDDAAAIEGNYTAARQVTIDLDFPHALITRKQLSNSDHNLCLAPWPWSSPLSRLMHARYLLFTRGRFLADAGAPEVTTQAPRGMVASAGGGLSIVEWKLQPGEQVIFSYRDFFGASENVRLRSEISLRLSTLLLGRIIFHHASCSDGRGEGRLLLKASVEDDAGEDIRAIPPERMIAWDRHARFTIHSGRTPWATLLNGYTLVRKNDAGGRNGRIVVSSADARSNLGSVRFVRRICSAIF